MNLIAVALNANNEIIIHQLSKKVEIEKVNKKKFNITYNPNQKYSIVYDKNIDKLNCIVGKNGSGKTTLLNTIFDNVKNKHKGSTFVFEQTKGHFIVTGDSSVKFLYEKEQISTIDETKDELNLRIIKYSSAIETTSQTKENKADNYDVSTTALLFENNLSELNQSDMFKQVHFVLNNRGRLKSDKNFIDLSTKKITIGLSAQGLGIYQIKKKFLSEAHYSSFLNLVQKNKFESKIEQVMVLKFLSIIYSELEQANSKLNVLEQKQRKNEWKFSGKNVKSMPKQLSEFIYIELFQKLCETKGEKYAYKYIRNVENCFNEIVELKRQDVFSKKSKLFSLTRENDVDSLLRIVENYFSTEKEVLASVFSVIVLEWQGVSSGEFSLLNLFGRISSAVEEGNQFNHLILLDEVDLGLHPEWQRKWVSTSLRYLAEILQQNNLNSHNQVIMTTHSPILLSDILTQDVLILNEHDKNISTFGQNIHTLFSESFIISDTMGEFSSSIIAIIATTLKKLANLNGQQDQEQRQQMIKNFYQKLNIENSTFYVSEEEFFDYLKFLIHSIGENVIRIKLLEMMARCLPKEVRKNKLQEQINLLEMQLREIGE